MKHIVQVLTLSDEGLPISAEILGTMSNETELVLLQTFFGAEGRTSNKRNRPVVVIARAEDCEAHESLKPGVEFPSTTAASKALGYKFNTVSHCLSRSKGSVVINGVELNYTSRVEASV
jgi:hypothetical protein